MKIVHLCLGCFFPDNYSYQENMLPKFHKEQGHEVEVIASLLTFDKYGNFTDMPSAGTYLNEYDIKVTRLAYRSPTKIYRKLKRFVGLYDTLVAAAPDTLFIHGCQFLDMDIVIRYLREHGGVRVFVDNHADFSNSARNWLSRNLLHKVLWRGCAQRIEPFTERFYGVLPVRVDFLADVYGLPRDKCELLVMGADDRLVADAAEPEVRAEIRRQYGLADDVFVVMTGGKIDAFKTQTLLLMEAVARISSDKVKLIVFGSVTTELKDRVDALVDGTKVQYIGWVEAQESYKYFAAADLVVFPGRHSVFWEQVAAQGVPMLCKDWPGTHHVDLGGNVRFLTRDSQEEIYDEIVRLIDRPELYAEMKRVAVEKGMAEFSYSDISRRCIQSKG